MKRRRWRRGRRRRRRRRRGRDLVIKLFCPFSILPFPGHLPSLLPYWLESLFSLPLWPLLAQPESLNSFSSLFSVSSRDHQRKDKEDSREMPHSPSGPESGNLPLALVTSFSGRVYHPLSSLTGSSVTQPFHSSFSCQRQLNIQD